jgi:hypothetical protein
MGLVAAVVVGATLGLWLALTVVLQLPRRGRLAEAIERHDIFGLIPRWTFFAPRPGTSDHFVLYRVRVGGEWLRWSVVPLAARRSPLSVVWHPAKRRVKVLLDVAEGLRRVADQTRDDPRLMCLSTPYLLLLALAANAANAHRGATAYQFAIATIDAAAPDRSARLLMQSEAHPAAP